MDISELSLVAEYLQMELAQSELKIFDRGYMQFLFGNQEKLLKEVKSFLGGQPPEYPAANCSMKNAQNTPNIAIMAA